MAKKLNVDLLRSMVDAKLGYIYISPAEGEPFLKHDPQLIIVNPGITDPADDNKVAAKLSEAGYDYLNSLNPKENSKMNYQIIKGAVPPASKRGNAKGGGAPTQYPFDDLEVDESFFVPVSDKHPNPVKTLGSTVSSANNRYAEETGEFEMKERTKRGAGNRAVTDANGEKVKETVRVAKKQFTRKFVLRGVEAGNDYGAFHADADGALITRVR